MEVAGGAMKGVVFTELMDLVSQQWGDDLLDQVIDDAHLPNDGAYTAVGTYPAEEMGRLVGTLSRHTATAVPDLLRAFGRHLFGRFAVTYPVFFEVDGPMDLLASVDGVIHIEVAKLYPDAELPRFDIVERTEHSMKLRYHSPRAMGALAEGLVMAAFEHWSVRAEVGVTEERPDGTQVLFSICVLE